ncbi:molybdenum cofactor guanylyltransferase [Cellulomonas massiliensis]|uniref:molybdenum cofactor guanylyltransferase n=1 Tax=Cellulomonas massiliensis TaxID=1465811 RepID=UPI000305FEB5|nr:NTP transferase domain-containing protein [Cellulomonas massiliensis]
MRGRAPELRDDGGTVAVLLSGGRARRLGGLSKARVEVGGRAMLDLVLDAVLRAQVRRVVVVGDPPSTAREGVEVTREEPAYGGPLAALAAGLEAVPAAVADVLVLACDLPRADELVPALLQAPEPAGADGAVLVDAGGREQWLAGRYAAAPLRAVVWQVAEQRGGRLTGAPLRAALGRLALVRLPDPDHASDDVDTPEDLARARAAASARPTGGGPR